MAQSPFFYYNPEQSADSRQHGLFSPHPSTLVSASQLQRFQQSMYPQELMSKHQHQQQAQIGRKHSPFKSHIHVAPLLSQPLVPVPSRPLHQKPAMIFTEGCHLSLDTECADAEGGMYPTTPPLSISDSTTSSPPMTSGVALTPTDPVFFAENMEGVKEGCEVDVKSEILAGESWARCGSPALTPGKKFDNLFAPLDYTIRVCYPAIAQMLPEIRVAYSHTLLFVWCLIPLSKVLLGKRAFG